MNELICQSVDGLESQLVEIRRYLHQHPELSGLEYETTRYLAIQLEKLGVDYRLGPDNRGLIVDFGSENATRRLALRADIDAVAVHDSKKVDYRSRVENAAHACGHDAHSAILFGAIVSLQQWFCEKDPNGAVRAIFQPEEETIQGAKRLIEWGVLDGVNAIMGLHVDPDRSVGTVALKEGAITAQCDEVLVEVNGQGGHAARPHETRDPIAAATQFLSACYNLVPRAVNSHEPTVLSFGAIAGGDVCNVIPGTVSIKGTLRTIDEVSRATAMEKIQQIADGISQATGTRVQLDFGASVPPVMADGHLTEVVQAASSELLGSDHVTTISRASMGGDDFAFYSRKLPASFMRVGCAGQRCGSIPLHHSGFDIDEKVLPVGAKVLSLSAARYFCTPGC